ncbi:MAG: energy-dependent translational throttle protein EttA [Acidobacteria bacterium]|nr:energy-dependent translational throttle protein EttA [Acidobacteriota bacterium]MEE2964377.1 energy-dependent translational throttle protein EttA [Acidobacteriota bacterium]
MAHQYVYTMHRLGKSYGPGQEVLKDISLSFLPGAKIGVLGLNGAGKSTLLKIMAGQLTDFTGEAFLSDGLTVGYLPQEPQLNPAKTVRGNVEEGVADHKGLLKAYDEVVVSFNYGLSGDELQEAMDEQGRLQDKIEAVGAWDLDSRVDMAMDTLRLPPPRSSVENLSGGERRRVALCRLMLQSPDLLLLDEPTNHLDAESVGWLERHLQQYKGTVVAITHDRYFLDNVAGWILELDRGEGIPWEGNYSSWLDQKQKRLGVEQKQAGKRQRTLQRELEWIQMSPRARQAKGKARLNAYEELLNQDVAAKIETVEIYIPPGPRLGAAVVEVKNIRKGYGERCLIQDLSFTLPPAGIVGVIGANGAGKTTMFRMIAGAETPDAGTLTLGDSVKLGHVDQSRELDPEKTVWEVISEGEEEISLGHRTVASRAYCSWFNFKGRDQQRKVSELSGGERNRVHLATLLKTGANVLLLDEPTNDLDVDTLRALEDALLEFAGCVVVISHDRWFLDRIATHILAFEGDSQVVWFQGNYQDYAADRRRRLGSAADRPHRIKYRRLVRA